MTSFQDREKAFESKYAHDEELKFKIRARRAKLFGLWIAGKLGLSGPDAEAYGKDMVVADLELPGDDDMWHKVRADLAAKGVTIADAEIQQRLDHLYTEAERQVTGEPQA